MSASDLATGKEQSVKIEKSSGLAPSEIETMRKDAESHAEDDARKRKLAEARNHAARLVYETEKLMKEHADKLDAGSKSADRSVDRKGQQGGSGGGRSARSSRR